MRLFDEKLRGTGRTTRLLILAEELAKSGRAVYIVTASAKEQRRLAKLLGNKNSNPYDNVLGIKVESIKTLFNFDWETCSWAGIHPNCVVLIDHFTVECEITRRLRGLEKAIFEMERYNI